MFADICVCIHAYTHTLLNPPLSLLLRLLLLSFEFELAVVLLVHCVVRPVRDCVGRDEFAEIQRVVFPCLSSRASPRLVVAAPSGAGSGFVMIGV